MNYTSIKYRVYLPAPSARRMATGRKIRIGYDCGGIAPHVQECVFPIPDDATVVNFEVSDEFITRSEFVKQGWIDGPPHFRIFCLFSNSTGSRTQEVELVPEVVKDE